MKSRMHAGEPYHVLSCGLSWSRDAAHYGIRILMLTLLCLGMSSEHALAQLRLNGSGAEFAEPDSTVFTYVQSTFDLASVEAQVAGTTYPMTGGNPFKATFPSARFTQPGPVQVRIKAVDVVGNKTEATVIMEVDRLPALQIIRPRQGQVMTDGLEVIELRAEDDLEKNVGVAVSVLGGVPTWGTNHLVYPLKLNRNTFETLLVGATDTTHERNNVRKFVVFAPAPSASLKLLKEVSGYIWAADSKRIAYLKAVEESNVASDALPYSVASIVVENRIGNGEGLQSYPYSAGRVEFLHLHEKGVFSFSRYSSGFDLRESGQVPLSVVRGSDHYRGGWGTWTFPNANSEAVLYSFDTGTFKVIQGIEQIYDVTEAGDILYGGRNDQGVWSLYLNKSKNPSAPLGERMTVPLNLNSVTEQTPARVDGDTFAYIAITSTVDQTSALRLKSPTQEITLPVQDRDFQITQGWLAYHQSSVSRVRQIWTRSPQGVAQQRSVFRADAQLETLFPNGWLTFFVEENNLGTKPGRYLSIPGQTLPIWISAKAGTVAWDQEAGQVLVAYFGNLYTYEYPRLSIQGATSANSPLTLELLSPAGEPWKIETSTDLRAWTELTKTSNTTGVFTYEVNPASVDSKRYYRASKE